MQPTTENKPLSFTQTFDNNLTETATINHTITRYIKGLQAEKAFLQQKSPANPRIASIQETLKTLATEEKEVTHATTQSPRFAFKASTPEESKTKFLKEKKNNFEILINSWVQVVQKNTETVSIIGRSGAACDFAHGEISLQELKDYNRLQENKNISSRIRNMYHLNQISQDDVILILKAKMLMSYGGENLVQEKREDLYLSALWDGNTDFHKCLKKCITHNNFSLSKKERALLQKYLKQVTIDPQQLKTIIMDRKRTLGRVILQDLEQLLETKPTKTDQVVYSRVGLLNMSRKGKIDGCVLNERTQGLDTFSLLRSLNNATIVFDQKEGSFIDWDTKPRTIHMPTHCSTLTPPPRATLNTVFFNMSIQGSNEAIHVQNTVNKAGKKALKHLNQTMPILDKKPTQNTLQLASTLQKLGFVTIHCFGGKDRTGALAAMMTQEALKTDKLYKQNIDLYKKLLVNETSILAKIADYNAGHSIAKVTALNLELFTLSERIRHYAGAGKVAIKDLLKVPLEPKAANVYKQVKPQ